MQTITTVTLTPGEFRAIIKDAIRDALNDYNKPEPSDGWPAFVSRQDLAARLNISPQTVTAWERRGVLQGAKTGRIIRYSRESVMNALKIMKK